LHATSLILEHLLHRGGKVVVAQSLAVTPQKAVEQFYAEFDSHKCRPRETEREAIRADAA